MKKTVFAKLAFAVALAAVMLVVGANISMAQPQLSKVNTDCPALECPEVIPSGYSNTDHCTFNYGHGCVLECLVWTSSTSSCYNNCNWQ